MEQIKNIITHILKFASICLLIFLNVQIFYYSTINPHFQILTALIVNYIYIFCIDWALLKLKIPKIFKDTRIGSLAEITLIIIFSFISFYFNLKFKYEALGILAIMYFMRNFFNKID